MVAPIDAGGRISKEGAPIRDLVNLLFKVFVKPDGKPYSSAEVAQETGKLNSGSLANLRSKGSKNVTLGTLQALITFFDVPLDYFTCETVEDAALFLARLRAGESLGSPIVRGTDKFVAQIVIKSMNLSEEARQDVLRFIEWIEDGDRARSKDRKAQKS